MTDLPKRAMALIGAILFLITSAGFTILVILESGKQNNNNTAQNASANCQITTGVEAEILADPETYIPSAPVTSLVKEDLSPGTGQEAKPGDCLNVKYYGALASDGQKFDSNFDKPTTIKFLLGQGMVIPGWDQGLVGMKVGGTRRLVIPPELAYKDQAVAQIPANSTLVFVVKLEKISN